LAGGGGRRDQRDAGAAQVGEGGQQHEDRQQGEGELTVAAREGVADDRDRHDWRDQGGQRHQRDRLALLHGDEDRPEASALSRSKGFTAFLKLAR
jgi:hypothetical protein